MITAFFWSIWLALTLLLGFLLHRLLNEESVNIGSWTILGRGAPWYFNTIIVLLFIIWSFDFPSSFDLAQIIRSGVFCGLIYLSYYLFSRRAAKLRQAESLADAKQRLSQPRPFSDTTIIAFLLLFPIALPLSIAGLYFYERHQAEQLTPTGDQIDYVVSIQSGDKQALLGNRRKALEEYRSALQKLERIRASIQDRGGWELILAAHFYRLGVVMSPNGRRYFDDALAILKSADALEENGSRLMTSIMRDSSSLQTSEDVCIRFYPLPDYPGHWTTLWQR
jgi:hypothetical protein